MSELDRRDFANVIEGPWMKADQLERLPPVKRQFDEARDPLIKKQLQDLDKTEAQRRGESGRADATLLPPKSWQQPSSQNSQTPNYQGTFLAEARDKAMAGASPHQSGGLSRGAPSHGPAPTPDYPSPSR